MQIQNEFLFSDLELIHNWVRKRGWQKSDHSTFGYSKDFGDNRKVLASNLFDALKLELKVDLD